MRESTLRALVGSIDQSSPGWAARSRILGFVGWRVGPAPGVFAPIGLADLAACGRTLKGAEWDLEVMGELASRHRALQRVPRRNAPDLWRLALDAPGDVAKWRGLPWVCSRAEVVSKIEAEAELEGVEWTPVGVEWTPVGSAVGVEWTPVAPDFTIESRQTFAASHVFTESSRPQFPQSEPESTPHEPESTPRSERESGASTGVHSTVEASPTPLSVLLRNTSVSMRARDGRTDGRTEELRTLTTHLRRAIKDITGATLVGEPLARLRSLAELQVDHADELVAYARSLTGLRRFSGVIAALESWDPESAAHGSSGPPGWRIVVAERSGGRLRVRLTDYATEAEAAERVAQLRAEGADVEGPYPVRLRSGAGEP